MSYYSKVSSRFWTGNTGRAIRGDLEAQVVATYLITSPHANMLGYYYLPIAYIANDTGISNKGASKALQRLCDEGFCHYDRGSEVVWIVEMARIQIGDALEPKDKRVIGIAREYESIPNNQFLHEFHRAYGSAFHMRKVRTFEAPSEPVAVAVAVAVAATAAVPAAATEPRSRGVASRPPTRPVAVPDTRSTWNLYSEAYRSRYGAEPTRNATTNAQMVRFVKRVGVEEGPPVAAFFVSHNDSFYVKKGHAVSCLMQDAEKLRTEWFTGRQVTGSQARQIERKAGTAAAVAEIIAEENHGQQTH